MGAIGGMGDTGGWRGERRGRHPCRPPPVGQAGSSILLVRHRERLKTYRESSERVGREGRETPMA
jgi:hypothetical protein